MLLRVIKPLVNPLDVSFFLGLDPRLGFFKKDIDQCLVVPVTEVGLQLGDGHFAPLVGHLVSQQTESERLLELLELLHLREGYDYLVVINLVDDALR